MPKASGRIDSVAPTLRPLLLALRPRPP
jgi:hypothetical protein